MKKFTVNRLKPRPENPGVWETVILRGGQLLFFTQDVIDNMKFDMDSTHDKYGYDLFAYCIEDEWTEYNRKLVTVKVIDLVDPDGKTVEVPDWYDDSLRLYVVKNRVGMPLAIVCKDMDCWYWQNKDRATQIREGLAEIYPEAFS